MVIDRARRARHEVDIVGLGHRVEGAQRPLWMLGECKFGRELDLDDLDRLRRIRELLSPRLDTTSTHLLLVGGGGFSSALRQAAADDTAVVLVDLDRLYHGD